MAKTKTSIPKSVIACGRCGQAFFVRSQIVLIQVGERLVPTHPYKRCVSAWEDVVVRQGQISKDGQQILPVGPDEE